MKKTIPAFLLFTILLNLGGYHLLFTVMQLKIKHDIKKIIEKGLDDKDLTVIETPLPPNASFKWKEEGKEFSYNGSMYDIVRKETKGAKTIYYCINDCREKQLIDNYAHKHKNKPKDTKLKRVLNNNFFKPLGVTIQSNHFILWLFTNTRNTCLSGYFSVKPPPPKS